MVQGGYAYEKEIIFLMFGCVLAILCRFANPACLKLWLRIYQPFPVTTDKSGQFVYVLNLQGNNFDPNSSNISAYRSHGQSGPLTQVLGSPFPAGAKCCSNPGCSGAAEIRTTTPPLRRKIKTHRLCQYRWAFKKFAAAQRRAPTTNLPAMTLGF